MCFICLGYVRDMFLILLGYVWDMFGILLGYFWGGKAGNAGKAGKTGKAGAWEEGWGHGRVVHARVCMHA